MGAPSISVVVPTGGRPAALAACLAALGGSTLEPDDLEIVVVGDGDHVDAPEADAAGAVPVVWIPQPHLGPAAARNRGARAARGEVVAFTDDDCRPAADWAEWMLASVREHPGALVAGSMRNGLEANPWSAASQLVLDTVVDMYNERPGQPGFVPSSNIALRRELFLALGGFDERFATAAGEDREFCDRCFVAGHPLVRVPTAVVAHFHELDLRRMVRQYAAYGRGEITYRSVCAANGRRANLVRRGFYLRLFGRALAHGPARGLSLAYRAAVSQVVFKWNFWAAARHATG